MALAPGTRIGPYEIAGTLGAGGMGEVYRATDTNLKRAVARNISMLHYVLLALTAAATASGVSLAQDSTTVPNQWLGVWKLNVEKSIAAGADPMQLRPTTTTISREAGGMRTSALTTGARGNPVLQDVTAKFDGKEYPVSNTNNTRIYRKIDANTYEYTQLSDGKELNTNRVVMAPDGKTRTMTRIARDAQGRTVTTVTIWDKQ